MKVGLVSDFTSSVVLDDQLMSASSSGVVLNSGVHSLITIKNLLSELPKFDYTLSNYDSLKEYSSFLESRLVGDLVEENGVIYQSIKSPNTGNALTDDEFWLQTNKDSIRLKIMINRVKDRVYNELGLVEKLVSNHYLYSEGDHTNDLEGDYSAWVFQAKGSEYLDFRINEIAVQANTTGNVNVYVVHQKELIQTLSVPVDNGKLLFNEVNYSFSGKGEFTFAIDSQSVNASYDYVDPYNYEGFTAYPATGTGATPDSSEYVSSASHNGMGFNITALFDPKKYIDNNSNEFARFVRQAFEYEFFEMVLHNTGNRRSGTERMIMEPQFIKAQLSVTEGNTVAKRYKDAIKEAQRQLAKAYDIQLSKEQGDDFIDVQIGSV